MPHVASIVFGVAVQHYRGQLTARAMPSKVGTVNCLCQGLPAVSSAETLAHTGIVLLYYEELPSAMTKAYCNCMSLCALHFWCACIYFLIVFTMYCAQCVRPSTPGWMFVNAVCSSVLCLIYANWHVVLVYSWPQPATEKASSSSWSGSPTSSFITWSLFPFKLNMLKEILSHVLLV